MGRIENLFYSVSEFSEHQFSYGHFIYWLSSGEALEEESDFDEDEESDEEGDDEDGEYFVL